MALILTFSCGPRPEQKRYEVNGRVVSVDPKGRTVTISHDDIPGYMEAMTMPFTLKSDWAFGVIKPGDQISAALVVEGERSWIEQPSVTRSAVGADGSASTAAGGHAPGDQFPAFELIDQDGQRFDTAARFKDKTLLLTFIYTRCPLPDYCILMSDHLAAVNARLNAPESAALRDKVRLLSISIDPQHDTPPVMREYGLRLLKNDKGGLGRWTFATGTPEEVQNVAGYFGLQYMKDKDQIIHSLRTAIVKPDGKLYKVYDGNKWTPDDALRDAARASE